MFKQLLKLMVLVALVWLSLMLLLSAIGLVVATMESERSPSAGIMRVLISVALFAVWAVWLIVAGHFWYLKVMRIQRK